MSKFEGQGQGPEMGPWVWLPAREGGVIVRPTALARLPLSVILRRKEKDKTSNYYLIDFLLIN